MDKETAIEITGGLSHPSKMPGYGFGIPASECKVGSALHEVPGSICSDCYAMKGMYYMHNVQKAERRRFDNLNHWLWVEAMAYLILTVPKSQRDYFRWHDSGDIQDLGHLIRIVEVCEMTPEVQHYMPTRERATVLSYLRNFGDFPPNLCVRLSAAMIDGKPSSVPVPTSTVHKDDTPIGFICPAPSTEGKCADCRACWDNSVKNVSYDYF